MKGGAVEALTETKKSGFSRFLGITAHRLDAPTVLMEALNRHDFHLLFFPLNFILFANPDYQKSALKLMEICHSKNIGMMTIKSITRGGWESHR